MPGENESDDGTRFPSDLGESNETKKTASGFTHLDPAQFQEYFAADLPAEHLAFMARWQVMNKAENLKGIVTTPAGEVNQAGCWWPQTTDRSTPISNAGMPRVPAATQSKSPAPATRSASCTRRRLQH
jgi:hypothetical protein